MEIYLIRHTRVAVRSGVLYGQADVGTAPTFEKEANAIKERIKNPDSLVYISSPLARCTKLINHLTSNTTSSQTDFITDNRIKELNFGKWELQPWQSLPQESFKAWSENYVNMRCPGGESFADLYERVSSFWDDLVNGSIINLHGDKNIAIVTHGGVIRAILARLLEIPLTNIFKMKINYSSISKIQKQQAHYSIDYINKY